MGLRFLTIEHSRCKSSKNRNCQQFNTFDNRAALGLSAMGAQKTSLDRITEATDEPQYINCIIMITVRQRWTSRTHIGPGLWHDNPQVYIYDSYIYMYVYVQIYVSTHIIYHMHNIYINKVAPPRQNNGHGTRV